MSLGKGYGRITRSVSKQAQENWDEKQVTCLLESEFLFLSYYYSEGLFRNKGNVSKISQKGIQEVCAPQITYADYMSLRSH